MVGQVSGCDYYDARTNHCGCFGVGVSCRPVVTSDGITGSCTCSACGGTIDPWDAYCRNCGARNEVAEEWGRGRCLD